MQAHWYAHYPFPQAYLTSLSGTSGLRNSFSGYASPLVRKLTSMFTGNECSIPVGIPNFSLRNQWIEKQFCLVRNLTGTFTRNQCSIPLGIANFSLRNQWIKNQFRRVPKLTGTFTGNES